MVARAVRHTEAEARDRHVAKGEYGTPWCTVIAGGITSKSFLIPP